MVVVTWDAVNKGTAVTLSNGNLTAVVPNTTQTVRASAGVTNGKKYWELKFSDASSGGIMVGIVNGMHNLNASSLTSPSVRMYYGYGAKKYPEDIAYGTTYAVADVIGVALDLDNGTLEFFKNGVSQGISHTNIKSMGEVFPAVTSGSSGSGNTNTVNFGATPFTYPVPTGFQSYDGSQGYKERVLILVGNEYKKWDITWQTIATTTPTEQQYLQGNTPEEIALIPASAWKELTGEVKVSYYTDNASRNSLTIETIVEPYTVYDEFGDFMEVLYYTDDLTKTSANLEVVANYSPLDELDDEFEVVTWTNDDTIVPNLNLTFLPKPQIVKMKENLPIEIKEVNAITMTSAIGGSGTLKVAISGDSGLSYKVWDTVTSNWVVINLDTELKSRGILVDEVNVLTKDKWALLFKTGEPKLRFAYYLEGTKLQDTVSLTTIRLSLVVPGRWKSGIPGTDYTYEYASGEKIYFTILADGNYKINYPSSDTIAGTSPLPTYDDTEIKNQLTELQINVMKAAFKAVSSTNSTKYQMNQMIVDDFNDTSGIDMQATTAFYKDGRFGLGDAMQEYDMSNGIFANEVYTSKDGHETTLKVTSGTISKTPHKLFDDNLTEGAQMGSGGTFYVLIKFDEPMTLTMIRALYQRTDNGSYDMKMVVNVSKDSTDGTDGTWVSLGDFVYNRNWNSLAFNERDIVYVKLAINNVASGWTTLTELKLHGIPSSYTSGAAYVQSLPETLVTTPKTLLLNAIEELNTGSILYEASIDGGTTWMPVIPERQTNLSALPVGTELVIRATLTGDAILHAWSYSWN